MDEKRPYRDLDRLMAMGRELHSQAIFESLAWLGARARQFGQGLAERNREVRQV